MKPSTISLITLVVFVSIAMVRSAKLPTTPSCIFNGKRYGDGDIFFTTPCIFCECSDGAPLCGSEDCDVPKCVDAVQKPENCCPTCPNGPNCHGPHGTIIPYGREVIIENQNCWCQPSNYRNVYVAECHEVVGSN
ncbi:hypothetical protein ACOMHN_060350 [Nucella lapillus]